MDTDLLGGQISMAFDATPTAMPLALAGKVRALGAGMATRIPSMPNLPTLQEQGIKGYECYTWNAILAPAGTPKPIVAKLNAAINKAMADPKVSDRTGKGRHRSDARLDAGVDAAIHRCRAEEMGADRQGVRRATSTEPSIFRAVRSSLGRRAS